ncbi:TipAS antibiotic-recognition domain-containing protein [Microbacterium aurum]
MNAADAGGLEGADRRPERRVAGCPRHPASPPISAEAQELAARHVAWLRGIPGTPAADPHGDIAGYVRGLGEMYVADERFGANYGGVAGATFVRGALAVYADRNL